MTAQIIDGKNIAAQLRTELADKIANLSPKPHLAVVLVGNDEASIIYDRNKKKAAEDVGMECVIHHLSENITEKELLQLVDALNNDDRVNGIIVQMPLPKHINISRVI